MYLEELLLLNRLKTQNGEKFCVMKERNRAIMDYVNEPNLLYSQEIKKPDTEMKYLDNSTFSVMWQHSPNRGTCWEKIKIK